MKCMTNLTERVGEYLADRAGGIQDALASPARSSRVAVVIGRVLGAAFIMCFITGLFSHFLQDPLPWMRFPTWPANLYGLTQGVHVTVGIACIPLVLGKLWAVYPKLFTWPPVRSLPQALERASIAVLVSAALLQVAMGLINTYQWYPWPFSFRKVHYALAWVIIGSLAIHIAVKLPIIVRHWRAASVGADDGQE